jgi:hypothetical protein
VAHCYKRGIAKSLESLITSDGFDMVIAVSGKLVLDPSCRSGHMCVDLLNVAPIYQQRTFILGRHCGGRACNKYIILTIWWSATTSYQS